MTGRPRATHQHGAPASVHGDRPADGEPPRRLQVTVHPRASRERLRWDGEGLELWLCAAPVDGAANAACRRMVAGWLGVAPSRVRLVAGQHGRHKLLEISAPERANR